MPVMLAIESSQRLGSVALGLEDGAVLEEAIQPAGYGDDLMAAVSRLCAAAGIRPAQVGAVIVDRGPGGFTGLRVGVTAAKLLAETTRATLVGVPGALVGAAGVPELWRHESIRRVLAVLAIKRRDSASTQAGTAWCALLDRANDRWTIGAPQTSERPSAPGGGHMLSLDDLPACAARSGAEAILAESSHLSEAVPELRQTGLPWFEPAWSARACLLIGRQALADGRRDDPALLTPLYAREAEAVTLWDAARAPRTSP